MTVTTSPGRVDVQFHFSPDFYTELVKATPHIWTDRWGVDAALTYLDTHRVAVGVLSVSTPGVDFLPADRSVVLARRLNDAAAEVVREHPGRFGSFATLPMQDVEATLDEIGYCLDTLEMDGVCMMSNVTGRYLGHPDFAPIFDELNRRRAVVFVHPTDPPAMPDPRLAAVTEWPFDTARAAVDLVYSGTLRRCPDLRVILAHAGGALPMIAGRVAEMSVAHTAAHPPVLAPEAAAQIAGFHYDLAISAHPAAIGALRGVSDLQHVLFACDWPFAPDVAVDANVAGFENLDLTTGERAAIERGTATSLFPRLMARHAELGRRPSAPAPVGPAGA